MLILLLCPFLLPLPRLTLLLALLPLPLLVLALLLLLLLLLLQPKIQVPSRHTRRCHHFPRHPR